MSIFCSNDIRGVYGKDLTEAAIRDITKAFITFLGKGRFAVGYDIRLSSPTLAATVRATIEEMGSTAIDIGMCGSEMMYFAVGSLELTAAL